MLKCYNNVGEKQYSQSRTCFFFPLCWLFNYIGVGRGCIYGALAECEPVQLKRLQANTQSHKAVPLGPRHPSTRLLMTAVRLPWREGHAASHWHRPGKSSWGRVVCMKPATETHFQRILVGGGRNVGERKPQHDSSSPLCKPLSHVPFTPTCWLEVCSLTAAWTKLPA